MATSYIDLSGRCQIRPISEADFERLALPRLPSDAVVWVYQNPSPMGIGGLLRVPGKPMEADVFLLMEADTSFEHDGARMMRFLLEQAHHLRLKRLVAVCSSTQGNYARFLSKLGFRHAYEEWDMWRQLPHTFQIPEHRLVTLPEGEGASLILKLYTETFSDEPWYLPYTNATHLLDDFGINSDLLFLYVENKPVGFAGVRYSEEGSAEIEIIGLIKGYQSSYLEQSLMHALLHHIIVVVNCNEVSLSVWRRNVNAITLAESFGFYRIQSRTYLDLNLAV
ncbi:MAG: GNAT family N-acetyltransferase [Candidatus Promineifilaceae bacterium]